MRSIHPLNALSHPVWLIALALLVWNDHYLKASGLMPGVSGKLSDFAGMLVAPVLLAVLLRVTTRQGLALCAAAVGCVFAAINLSPEIASSWDALVSLVVPYRTTVDPTDLIALAMLPIGIAIYTPSMEPKAERGRGRRAIQVAMAVIGIVMCSATSEDESCTADSDCHDGETCVNEWCEVPPQTCSTDADCPEEYLECAEGICHYRPNCSADTQCPSGTCEPDGRCDLAGVPIGGSTNMSMMMDPVEAQSIDLQTRLEVEQRPIQGVDPVVLDYLHDSARPATVD